MKTPIGIIGGTPIDTKFWERFLWKLWYINILSYNISKSPEEQNHLQLHYKEQLQEICFQKIQLFKASWCKKVIIYCNSLTSVLDLDMLNKNTDIQILSPLDIYKDIWNTYKKVTLLAANSWGANIVEKSLPHTLCLSIWWLEIVSQIENHVHPFKIIDDLNLEAIIKISETRGYEVILLACTHFPYIRKELQKISRIPVIDLNMWFKKVLWIV